MQFLSFTARGAEHFGVVRGAGVAVLGERIGLPSLRELLRQNRLAEVQEHAAGWGADLGFDEIQFQPPIPDAEKIICVGVNYMDRNAEYNDGSAAPKYPSLFIRTRESVTGHGQPLLRPPESPQLDYEGEIAMVIGREGRRISRANARNHVAGLTLMNEGSLRDWVRHGKFNVTPGKNFEKSGAIGPWFTTLDEIPQFDNLQLTTRVNGEVRQDDNTARLAFPFEYLIEYISTFMRLKPGDIISTGTPSGAGARFDPPRYLVPGDSIEITSPGIGTLENGVADEML